MRGLYYSYIITSQSYLIVRSNGIVTFNKPDIVDIAVELVVELVDAIIVVECYKRSTVNYY